MVKQQCTRLVTVLALAVGALLLAAPRAEARKNCTCVMSTGGWNKGVVQNLGVVADYADLDVKAPGKCSKACSDRCTLANFGGSATNGCALLGWKSGCVRCHGYIGQLGTNNADGTLGTFTCAPAVTQLKCPTGWTSNTTQTDGGVTTDGKCKKAACQPDTIPPYPANGTPIGSGPGAWGFSWGNAFYAWGTSANGGAPIMTTITPQSAAFNPGC